MVELFPFGIALLIMVIVLITVGLIELWFYWRDRRHIDRLDGRIQNQRNTRG